MSAILATLGRTSVSTKDLASLREDVRLYMELILQSELLIFDQCLHIPPRSGVHVRGGSD